MPQMYFLIQLDNSGCFHIHKTPALRNLNQIQVPIEIMDYSFQECCGLILSPELYKIKKQITCRPMSTVKQSEIFINFKQTVDSKSCTII